MAERNEETPDLTAQVRRHLESLRAAGVEWLPAAAPPPTRIAAVPLLPPTEAPATPSRRQRDFSRRRSCPRPRRRCPSNSGGWSCTCSRSRSAAARAARNWPRRGRRRFSASAAIDPDLCFIGEAPGRDEDAQGEPFVGPAGQLLTRIIAAMGMTREEVYICNILRCRPPNNRQPLPDEAANCREWLEKTLELVRPKFLCALGGTAAKFLLGTTQGVTRLRGKFFTYKGVPVMCTFHPSFLLRAPENKREVWEDMKLLLAKMGRPVPSK